MPRGVSNSRFREKWTTGSISERRARGVDRPSFSVVERRGLVWEADSKVLLIWFGIRGLGKTTAVSVRRLAK